MSDRYSRAQRVHSFFPGDDRLVNTLCRRFPWHRYEHIDDLAYMSDKQILAIENIGKVALAKIRIVFPFQATRPAPPKRSYRPGSKWRILAQGDGTAKVDIRTETGPAFDEVVIDDWFHLEQFTEHDWHAYVGGVRMDIHVGRDGKTVVRVNGAVTQPEGG